ncbi:MAG: penicillin-binding protein family [Cyanobacteria bacterium RYN_339]|nr:penicillin-binding protein family [Cyanobacteria bacterium RYN_339]
MSSRRPRKAPSGRREKKQRPRGSWFGQILIGMMVVVAMGLLGLATGIALMVSQIPSVDSLLAARPLGTTKILDREGRVVASVQNGENREIVPLADISPSLQHAVVASEDIRFFEHHGLDPRALMRALFSSGKAGGGSTLTQQLAKNLFLNADRTATRKIADMYLAIQLERTLPKEKILEMYLNQVYFGHGAYGVESASRKYFGKKAKNINDAEAAMLAGLLPAPEYYSPYRNPKPAKERQAIVLKRMVDAGFLTAAEAEKNAKKELQYANTPDYAYRAPYFTSQVLTQLSDRLGADLVMRGALKIYTTMDLTMQEEAEGLIRRGVGRLAGMHVGEGALVAIEPGTGAVRALVGGTNYDKSPFNRAVQAHRQPGSTFKPFVYLTAFTKGYGPYTTVADVPTNFGRYAPQNYDRTFRGVITFERAVASSVNVAAVKVANMVGIENVIKTAQACGIKSPLEPNLSLALGSAEVTPLELASAYATLGASGAYAEPHFVTRVEDHNGNLIDQFPVATQAAVPEEAVWALNTCLKAVVNYGSGTAANFGRPCAGKTGTTSDARDTWFAGYTPDLACVIWLGNDDNSKLAPSATGGALAAPLWAQFMKVAHAGLPVRDLKTSGSGVGSHLSSGQESGTGGKTPVNPDASPDAPTESASPALPVPSADGLEGHPLDEPIQIEPSPEDVGTKIPTARPVPPIKRSFPTARPATPEPEAEPSMDVIQ